MPNQPKTPQRTVRIPEVVWSAAKALAVRRGETLSDVIRKALERYIDSGPTFVLLLVTVLMLSAGCTTSSQASTPPADPHAQAPTAPAWHLPTVRAGVHHLDAHDGAILQAGHVFYEYGTSYNCGFQFGVPGTRFCGINIYASRDLVHWGPARQAFDPDSGDWQQACTPGGCFRPHVVHNAATGQYVMWLNVFTGTYRVLTAPTPIGPWTLTDGGDVAAPSGDETLFADLGGAGYLVRTDLAGKVATGKSHELEIDRLDDTYTHVTGVASRAPVGFVEAPSLFRRHGGYYLTFSDPACPYCTGTGTSAVQAVSLDGPWSRPYSITAKSCGGQPTGVSAFYSDGRHVVWLYQSDRWVRLGHDHMTRNQSRATQAWSPLTFDQAGHIRPVRCS